MANDDIVTKKEYREWQKEMAEFARESWQRLTKRAVDLGWTCGICKSSNLESDLVCGLCDTPRPSH